jgi:hypothetical protein
MHQRNTQRIGVVLEAFGARARRLIVDPDGFSLPADHFSQAVAETDFACRVFGNDQLRLQLTIVADP